MSSFCRELDGDGEALPAACKPKELFSCSRTGLFQPSAPVSNCVPSLLAAASCLQKPLKPHTHIHTPAHTKWGRGSRGESINYFHSDFCLQPRRGLKGEKPSDSISGSFLALGAAVSAKEPRFFLSSGEAEAVLGTIHWRSVCFPASARQAFF